MSAIKPGLKDLETKLISVVSRASGVAQDQIDPADPLERFGINSTMIVELAEALSADFPDMSTSLFFEHRTIAALAAHLADQDIASQPSPAAPNADMESPAANPVSGVVTDGEHTDWLDAWLPETAPLAQDQDIAIVAMSGRYPDAADLNAFWKNLCDGRDSVTEVPTDRWDMSAWFDPDADREDRVYAKWGGFLDGIDKFDARFFNVSPREAKRMDPQERLFLQEAWRCLEGAGFGKTDLAGSRTGVFVGAMWSLYQLYGAELTASGKPDAASSSFATIANRLSWFLDLRGPSMTVDTMCSSALTAMHLAMQALQRGACDQAVVGGVNLCVHPAKYIHLSRGSFAAKDGKCRAFGAGGSGYVPGEGVGVVLIKPLSKAIADSDKILAVVKACDINHGGNTHGYTVPNPTGQNAAISSALATSGMSPDRVRYVEAHGTGTALGDPIEVEGLLRSYGQGDTPLRIGSVKTNIGHLEAAAGMAGLHKLILQMQHGQLVPSLHADVLNPNINWDRLNVKVQTTCEPLDLTEGDSMALSAFGAGGSNAHLVLAPWFGEEAQPLQPDTPLPFVFSAANDALLTAHLAEIRDWLKTDAGAVDLVALAQTLAQHRDPMAARTAVMAANRADLVEQLQAWLDGQTMAKAWPAPVADWVAGGTLDATTLFAGTTAKRQSCPPRPFDEKSYWLAKPCGPNGVSAPRAAGPEARVFAAQWQPLATAPADHAKAPDLIVSAQDCLSLAQTVATGLGLRPGSVLSLDQANAQTLATHSRVLLLTGAAENTETLVRDFGWLLERAQKRSGFDCLHLGIDATNAPLGQLIRLLPAEQGRLVSNSISIPQDLADVSTICDLWARFAANALPLCATLRQTARGTEILKYTAPDGVRAAPAADGWHVITGGTGGIGLRLAAHLAQQGVTRLILTGRRALPDRASWDALIDDTATDAALRDKLRRLRALPKTTRCVTWDVQDAAQLGHEFAKLEQEAPLSLVVHLAGVVDDPTVAFVDKSDATVAKVLGAKLCGARALVKVLPKHARLLLVSSQSAAVPKLATGVLDYAMANGALNDLALNADTQVQSLMLPNWRGAGFGDAETAHLAQLGLPPVQDASGLGFFDATLTSPAKVVFAADITAEFDLDQVFEPAARKARSQSVAHPQPQTGQSASEIVTRMAAAFAPVLDLDPSDWGADDRFSTLGVDSVLLTRLGRKLEAIVGAPVAADVMIAHDTLDALAGWVAQNHPNAMGDAPADAAPAAPVSTAPVLPQPSKDAKTDASTDQGIAIVGIGTVLPGAETVDAYWQNLLSGRDLITEVPADRWPVDAFYGRDGDDSTPSKWGAFVEDLAHFDAQEFGLPKTASEATDPLVRLALWATRGALSDAGLREKDLRGAKAGVFLGSRVANWADRLPKFHRDSVLGTAQNFIAAHICHWLDLNGPGMVVDTACSSSLYATHLACASLRSGECDLALAGGSECLLDERPYQMLGRTGAMSPTGRCRTFDANADGFVPGEGAVTLVLKRLSDARAQGDRIYAVIEGSAVNNDGRTMGVTTPNPERQKDVIRQALVNAGAQASEIGYVEAHGTGTALGDPMELRGLTEVFAEGGARDMQVCGIGSVKTNIGHLLSSAGASGLAKVALQLHHKTLVPTLNCDTPNPRFAFDQSPFFPVLEAQPFTARGPLRRAGISGFGFGGTNVHIQLSDRQCETPHAPTRMPLPVPERTGAYHWHPRPDSLTPAHSAPTPSRVAATASKPSPAAGFQLVRTN